MSRPDDTQRVAREGRRSFLKGAAAAGGAVSVAVATGASAAVEEDSAPTGAEAKGYRETAHIRAYYETAGM